MGFLNLIKDEKYLFFNVLIMAFLIIFREYFCESGIEVNQVSISCMMALNNLFGPALLFSIFINLIWCVFVFFNVIKPHLFGFSLVRGYAVLTSYLAFILIVRNL